MDYNILKIGEVIEVRGQKVRAKVYQDKNTSSLNYNGEIIRNVSVGSFVKIRKNFLNIIGKVEGEYVDNKIVSEHYMEKNQNINRIIEISIVGRIEDNKKFKRGLSELPLISNYVYILSEKEVQEIFAFVQNEPIIEVGYINAYEQYKLSLGVQDLFGSHIGIFGNTGSGKSNTLAKIYTELFEQYENQQSFILNGKFILIDFNGEYSNAITDKKNVLKLSTRHKIDTYNLDDRDIQDLEFWSIILEATEKTQQPFLKRSINQYQYLIRQADSVECVIRDKTIEILDHLFDFGYKYNSVKRYYEEIITVGYKNIETERDNFLNNISFNSTTGSWYSIENGITSYRNTEEDFKQIPSYNALMEKLKSNDCMTYESESLDYWSLLEFAMKYQYVYDVQRGFVNEEHIAPVIRRLDTRLDDMRKVFSINDRIANKYALNIISLVDVNIYMKKIVPMLICKKEYDKHKQLNGTERKNSLHIIVDEAHNILSKESERESSSWKDYRLEVFEEIIKEGRKFGVFLTLASQRPSDISDTIISQLHNYFLHRLVNSEDIKAIGKTVSFLDAASYEMIPILPQGACIVTGTACNFPIIVQVEMLERKRRPHSKTIDLDKIWND